ncbi:MAG: HNH endonuclease [Deltaproteobacteria bacterium]|nr:HNH endonuclease [Deltaproteobacteria bacterium]
MNWTEHELLIAMNLYCRLSFGQCNSRNKLVNEVASKMDRTAGSISRKLGNIASLDPRHQARGVGGLPNSSKLDRKVWSEFQDNWSTMAEKSEVAFEALMGGTGIGKPAPEIEQPRGPSEVERMVKTRRLQTFFRNAVLSSYENRYALTGIAVPQLLIASHIIPWNENENRRADPTNGLCLNALHDKAFDRHLITFDKDCRLVVSSFLKKGDIPEFQAVNFAKLEGVTLMLPHRFAPDPRALEEHRNAFVA